ncbi:MAG: hypothetical protein ACYTXT_28795 [Nostoc sp.]
MCSRLTPCVRCWQGLGRQLTVISGWIREWGMSVVGNASTCIGGLLRSQHVATQANIALLSAADNDDYSFVDQNFQPESLQTWGKRENRECVYKFVPSDDSVV